MLSRSIKLLVTAFAFMFITVSAYAGTLSEIEITQDNNGNYNVVFSLDTKTNIVKENSSKGNLSLLLKGTNLSDNLNISYENSTDLQNVVVQKKNKDNSIVLLEGKNIEEAKILAKDVNNGEISEIKLKNNSLLFSIFGVISLFMLLAIRNTMILRRKRRRFSQDPNELIKKKIQEVNTLRKKNKQQSKNIPSINYNLNNSKTTIPEGFVINNYKNNQESRKVG